MCQRSSARGQSTNDFKVLRSKQPQQNKVLLSQTQNINNQNVGNKGGMRTKQLQSLDNQVQPIPPIGKPIGATADQTNAGLCIPQQTVRRHSIGASTIASASIIERLRAIANENKQINSSSCEDENSDTANPSTEGKLVSNQIKRHGTELNALNANAGTNAYERGKTAVAGNGRIPKNKNEGSTWLRALRNSIRRQNSSDPDLRAGIDPATGHANMLTPLNNQMAARMCTSDVRLQNTNPSECESGWQNSQEDGNCESDNIGTDTCKLLGYQDPATTREIGW